MDKQQLAVTQLSTIMNRTTDRNDETAEKSLSYRTNRLIQALSK